MKNVTKKKEIKEKQSHSMSLKAGVVENYLEYDSRDFDKVSSSQMAD